MLLLVLCTKYYSGRFIYLGWAVSVKVCDPREDGWVGDGVVGAGG